MKVSNYLEIFTNDGISYRVKVPDDLDLELLAVALASSLGIGEDYVQIVPPEERNNNFFAGQINDVKEKLLSGAKIAGLGKIFKNSKHGANMTAGIGNQKSVGKFCPNCGTAIDQTAEYCTNCGKKLF